MFDEDGGVAQRCSSSSDSEEDSDGKKRPATTVTKQVENTALPDTYISTQEQQQDMHTNVPTATTAATMTPDMLQASAFVGVLVDEFGEIV